MTRPRTQGPSAAEIIDAFGAMMRAEGIEPPATIVADGRLHRFHVAGDKPGTRNGAYVLHLDGVPSGYFEAFRLAIKRTWSMKTEGTMSAAEREAHRQRMAAAEAAREKDEVRRQSEAAKRAATILAAGKVEDSHPYTDRKGIALHGLPVGAWPSGERDERGTWHERSTPGALLVPVSDIDGTLRSVQAILPDGEKRFLPGGRKRGCFHLLGVIREGVPLLIAEGFATGATLADAMGYPVAIAFDAGNLAPVADALRARYPTARLVICADDDVDTEGNPGRTKAEEAARNVGGIVALPVFKNRAKGASDFNDMAASEGVDAVRHCIEVAMGNTATPDPLSEALAPSIASPSASPPPAPPAVSTEWQRFQHRDDGLYFQSSPDTRSRRVCAPIAVVARTRDPSGRGWGLLVRFKDPDGREHRLVIASESLAGEGIDAVRALAHEGLEVAPNARRELVEYLIAARPTKRAFVTNRLGWHGDITSPVFVTPTTSWGVSDDETEWRYSGEVPSADLFRTRGTLAEWREFVASPCVGNSRLVFPVSVAFSSALLFATGGESGVFHLAGNSSEGKTTALHVTVSVSGGPDSLQRWRATVNALEGIAASHCDSPMCLDEIAQVDTRASGDIAYTLGNGQGKSRADRTGSARARLTWRVAVLSSGEVGLATMAAEVGGKTRAGQEVRVIEIPSAPQDGIGIFETIHDAKDGASFAQELKRRARRYYGTAFPAFVAAILPNLETLGDDLRELSRRFLQAFVPAKSGAQVRRVAERFALVALGGELATQHGITGWPDGAAFDAAGACFRAWLQRRGTTGNSEEATMIAQARAFLELHGEGRFSDLSRNATTDDHAPKTLYRAGWRKAEPENSVEYWVLPETFRAEIAKGHEAAAMARALANRGYLRTPEKGRLSATLHVPGEGNRRVYIIAGRILEGTDDA